AENGDDRNRLQNGEQVVHVEERRLHQRIENDEPCEQEQHRARAQDMSSARPEAGRQGFASRRHECANCSGACCAPLSLPVHGVSACRSKVKMRSATCAASSGSEVAIRVAPCVSLRMAAIMSARAPTSTPWKG